MKIHIIADSGSYQSVEMAAFSEKEINWWDEKDERRTFCTESFAAIEIGRHLEETGCEVFYEDCTLYFDVEILVGATAISSVNKGFVAEINGKDGSYRSFTHNESGDRSVWIWGGDCFKTLRAAYAWLGSLGFRWYTPDMNGTIIPRDLVFRDEQADLNYEYITRGCYNEFIDDDNPGFIDWAARNGMNMIRVNKLINPHGLKKRGLAIMGGGHEIFYRYLNPLSAFSYEYNNVPAEFNKAQDANEYEAKNQNYADGRHTCFDMHPEWFALINGIRSCRNERKQANEGYYTGDNFCTSNMDAVAELAKNMLVSFENGQYKYLEYLNLWAYDNGKWCECENCRKLGNLSRRMLMLGYEINKFFKDAFNKGIIGRQIRIVIPVYHETLEPPDKPLPEDFDYEHIIATFFPIERCYAHDINDENCTETNLQLKTLYEKWTPHSEGNYKGALFIGEYYNVSSFASLPFVFTKKISNDLPYYSRTGTGHFYYMHISAKNWGTLAINNGIIAGLLKSSDFEINEFLDEFYRDYYPDTGKMVREFHEKLEEASANMKYLKHYQFSGNGEKISLIGEILKKNKFPLEHCKYNERTDNSNNAISFEETMDRFIQAEKLIKRAMGLAKGIELERLRIEIMRFDYGYMVMNFIMRYVELREAIDNGNREIAEEIFRETEKLRDSLIKITKPLEEMKYECPWYENAFKATWHAATYEVLRQNML